MDKKLYKDYFQINPKYFPQVTEALIKENKVSWKNYFANDSFIDVLKQTTSMINGLNTRSIFTWGPYGSGKSHLVLTIISMLKASDDEIREYFAEQNLSTDVMDNFITAKDSGKIITIHRIGSANIKTETDLVIAVQQSIMAALEENGIKNQGEASMQKSFLDYISDDVNRRYFGEIIKKEEYAFDFAGENIDYIESVITGTDTESSEKMMRKVINVMRDIGQYGILKDCNAMSAWIKDIIEKNDIKAIVFAWDEFSEFIESHPMGLTGFQTLLEISLNSPFYFIIVTHQENNLFEDREVGKKFLDRFQKPVEISLPENTAFKLLSQAMKITSDPALQNEWINHIKPTINGGLRDARQSIIGFDRYGANKKSKFNDEDLQNVVPIHPYAALILRQIASMFNSNQRSMFDFIINEDEEAQGFKCFINTHSPFDDKDNILTVDMLWDFFCSKQVAGLNSDVRGIFTSYDAIKSDKLLPEQQKVLKTILILQAVGVKVLNDDLLAPTEKTVDLAFKGTDWSTGKALAIAKGLCDQNLVFEKPMANGQKEFCVANGNVNDDIAKHKEKAASDTTTSALIVNAKLPDAVVIPKAVEMRYCVKSACYNSFLAVLNEFSKREDLYNERFKTVVTFAIDDIEAAKINQQIIKQVSSPQNNVIFIESLVPMGHDLKNRYLESLSYSYYYAQKDKDQARHYQDQANSVLREWYQNVSNGAFKLYVDGNVNGERKANITDLQDALKKYNFTKYPSSLEQYQLNGTLYTYYGIPSGAEYGLKQEIKSAYDKKLETALAGAFNIPDYWRDSSKQSLVIYKVKNKIEEIIKDGFENKNGEVSLVDIFSELEKPPFGFMPNSIAAYILGFCLKEYANSNYFWSNHSTNETMTVDKMKGMIANAISQKVNPQKNYKTEYMVTMTPQIREFLRGSAKIFQIAESSCTSIEAARDQIRIKMKSLQFPIWCLEYIPELKNLKSVESDVVDVIESYISLANTANSQTAMTESQLAEKIGGLFIDQPELADDLRFIMTSNKCREGMVVFISQYKDGELTKLAQEIGDNGEYITEVNKKFNASDGNWVWNKQTSEEKISDVILDYKIIQESNKTFNTCKSLSDVITEWNRRTNNIKMPCESIAKMTGDLGVFLWELNTIKKTGTISDQNKQRFYDLLRVHREDFDAFYKDQLPYFEKDAQSFLTDVDKTDVEIIFNNISAGQFTKSKTDYYNYIQQEIKKYLQSQKKIRMLDLWLKNTGSKNPVDWSDKYNTPILCMVPVDKQDYARKMFDIIKSANPSEDDVDKAIAYMENIDYYEKLQDKSERDRLFKEFVVGNNSVLLDDLDEIRNELRSKIPGESPYHWMSSNAVKQHLKLMVDKAYKLNGIQKAENIIDSMDATQLREYLKQKINDDAEFGIQILKGEA